MFHKELNTKSSVTKEAVCVLGSGYAALFQTLLGKNEEERTKSE
jgi:hypothetical protein